MIKSYKIVHVYQNLQDVSYGIVEVVNGEQPDELRKGTPTFATKAECEEFVRKLEANDASLPD